MNLFFGKISQKYDIKQIDGGYYKAPKGSSWFGDISLGDYVYLIGGDKIQLWKAREWGTKDGEECLYFDIILKDLGIKINQLIALRFLKLSKALIVLTVRSARNRAFFKLEMCEDATLDLIKDANYYQSAELYRNIRLINESEVKADSKDLQIYYSGNTLTLYPAAFYDSSIIGSFRDNFAFAGKGAKMKDTVLDRVSKALQAPPTIFTSDQLSIRSFYDTFFCDYKDSEKYFLLGAYWKDNDTQDMTEKFISESVWKNGYDDKNLKEVNSVPVGAQVAIKSSYTKGKSVSVMKIKARGIVKNNLLDGHTLEIQWEDDFKPYEIAIGGYLGTIKEVTNREHIQKIWNYDFTLPNVSNDTEDEKKALNQILYGPPGTGKTYFSIDTAVEIATGKSADHDANKLVFDKLRKDGQIDFVTFHQNYSYEDFVVGIKPNTEAEALTFRPHKGIFYKLVERAKENYLAWKSARSTIRSFDEVFEELVAPLEKNSKVTIQMASGAYFEIVDVVNGTIKFVKPNGSDSHTLSVDTLEAIVNGKREFHSGLGSYYKPLVKLLKEKQNVQSGLAETLKRYVLVIDEINRANISRVFGELITLLEDDKRIDAPNALSVTLPNGEVDFSVPPNLYVVGTMNTADKSIALIDIALRRRFEFKGFYPDYDALKKYDPNRQKLLEEINRSVYEKKKTADFLIGHGYMMKDEKTEDVLVKKIIPLLMEYFSGRVSEVESILGQTNYPYKYNSLKYKWELPAIQIDEAPVA